MRSQNSCEDSNKHTDRQIYANTILDMGTNRHDRRGVCSWYSSKLYWADGILLLCKSIV